MKTVLLTGANGAIGSALAESLIKEGETHIILLLRAASAEHLSSKVQALHDFWQITGNYRQRVEIICGDVTQAEFALSPREYASITQRVSHVIHAAGDVRLNLPEKLARQNAIGGLQQVLRFAKDCRGFERLEYLSTIGVAGRTTGLVPEAVLIQPRSFRNSYEAAKAEAEDQLLAEVRSGFPAAIYRPSMVVGDSQTGKVIRFQVFYHLLSFLSGSKTAGFLPRAKDFRLDIIPLDFVVRAMLLAQKDINTCGQIFHLVSGPQKAISLIDLVEMARRESSARSTSLPPVRWINPRLLSAALCACSPLIPGRTGKALQTLRYFLDYVSCDQLFDNSNTAELLARQQMAIPPIEEYFGDIIAYYRTHGGSA